MMYYGVGYSDFSTFHWLAFTIMVVVIVYPLGRILSRLGYSPFWCIVAFIPVVNLIGLWILALTEWPREHVDV